MGLDTSYNYISEVLSLLQKYKQKMITHVTFAFKIAHTQMKYADKMCKIYR